MDKAIPDVNPKSFQHLYDEDSLAIGAGFGAGTATGCAGGAETGGGGDSSLVFFDDFFLNSGNPFIVVWGDPAVQVVC